MYCFVMDEIVTIIDAKKFVLENALKETGFNRTAAAKIIGCSVRTLRDMIRKYSIHIPSQSAYAKTHPKRLSLKSQTKTPALLYSEFGKHIKQSPYDYLFLNDNLKYLGYVINIAKTDLEISDKLREISESALWLAQNDPVSTVVIIDFLCNNYQKLALDTGMNDGQILKILDMFKNAKNSFAQQY